MPRRTQGLLYSKDETRSTLKDKYSSEPINKYKDAEPVNKYKDAEPVNKYKDMEDVDQLQAMVSSDSILILITTRIIFARAIK